jgi:hypothetical protein
MNEYIKTFGEPGERKIRTHICSPGMDLTICGLDVVGDDMIHDKDPEILSRGKKHRVTCEDCLRIIDAVKDHLSPANVRGLPPATGGAPPPQVQVSRWPPASNPER